ACITANWLSAKQVLEQHGCFDANLKSGGDHEMSKRLSRNGFPVVFCKEAIVNHPARSFDEILKKRRRVIGGAWDKNSSKLKPISMYWRASKLFIRRILTTLFGTKATIQKKFSVMKVVIAIFVVSLAEITRLMVGNTSSRS
ncbi:MAG: GT2 family glycosyltransferase, partial [Alteromonas macleodii]